MSNTRIALRAQAPRRRAQPEREIQIALLEHLRLRGAKGLIVWHCPNGAFLGGKRHVQAAVLKKMGMRPGVGDLLFLKPPPPEHPHEGARFFSLEIKAHGNTSTEAQIKWRSDVNRCGGFAAEVVGLDAALACLQAWGLLREVSR
jgi:hypothetical protein